MGRVSEEDLHAAYEAARAVHNGSVSSATAINRLKTDRGMNENTARDHIDNFGYLHRGVLFKRELSSRAVEIFLERMLRDDGPEVLGRAIHALREHINYRRPKKPMRLVGKVVDRYAALAAASTLDAVLAQFQANVERAQSDTVEARRQRLAVALPKPPRRTVEATVFERNPDVVAEVLFRANGVCERCREPAPFITRSGRPYLEVHHLVRLTDDGDDTVENARAICPNCHRELHFGVVSEPRGMA